MKLSQVGIQLYTLRKFCQTAADLASTLKKVRVIGYPAIQVSGVGPIPAEEIAAIAAGEGLTICATHEPANVILAEPEKVVERLHKLGCRHTSYPHPTGLDFRQPGTVAALAASLDAAGAVLAAADLVLSYHNHQIEFARVDGSLVLDQIYSLTNPRHLQGEIDTYWVQFGGGDPVAWCRKLANRLPLLHLKDYAINSENQATFAEIGSGNLNFPEIIAAAEASGCEWFVVEQDTCAGDPFESIRISLDYITSHLITA